jgi:hypothetical protein
MLAWFYRNEGAIFMATICLAILAMLPWAIFEEIR